MTSQPRPLSQHNTTHDLSLFLLPLNPPNHDDAQYKCSPQNRFPLCLFSLSLALTVFACMLCARARNVFFVFSTARVPPESHLLPPKVGCAPPPTHLTPHPPSSVVLARSTLAAKCATTARRPPHRHTQRRRPSSFFVVARARARARARLLRVLPRARCMMLTRCGAAALDVASVTRNVAAAAHLCATTHTTKPTVSAKIFFWSESPQHILALLFQGGQPGSLAHDMETFESQHAAPHSAHLCPMHVRLLSARPWLS